MHPTNALRSAAPLLAVLLLASTAPATAATWKWRDAEGRTVYSDLPPPPGARATILAAPRDAGVPAESSQAPASGEAAAAAEASGSPGAAAASGAATAAAQGAAPGAVASKPDDAKPRKNEWVERAEASRKLAEERAKLEKLKADERRQVAELERACEDARTGLRTLESGIRLKVVDAQGRPQVLDEAERARRAEVMRRTLAERCEKRGG